MVDSECDGHHEMAVLRQRGAYVLLLLTAKANAIPPPG